MLRSRAWLVAHRLFGRGRLFLAVASIRSGDGLCQLVRSGHGVPKFTLKKNRLLQNIFPIGT
jgi:hypothetical protein